jgi:ABC-type multidrug transport system fused ATPase/permease subunit
VGERQLLSLARAAAADPKILILDEATANVDSHTEALVQEALEKVMAGRTTIAIAHRLSTIRNSDRVLVIHEGKLVEEGTVEELLARKGLFWALWQLQFAGARDNLK